MTVHEEVRKCRLDGGKHDTVNGVAERSRRVLFNVHIKRARLESCEGWMHVKEHGGGGVS